jgi:TetR/AcrR family fatty acid metabolism transcriptional regulator
MAPAGSTSQPKRRTAPPRDVIVDAAAELFSERGYHGARMQEIADRAGIAKPTLYVYGKSKLALLEAIYQRVIDDTDRALTAIDRLDDPVEQLSELIRAWITIAIERRSSNFVFFSDETALPERLARWYRRWSAKTLQRVRDIVKAGQAAEAFSGEIDATAATFAIISSTQWTVRWWTEQGPLDREALIQNHIELFERGLLTPTARRKTARRRATRHPDC